MSRPIQWDVPGHDVRCRAEAKRRADAIVAWVKSHGGVNSQQLHEVFPTVPGKAWGGIIGNLCREGKLFSVSSNVRSKHGIPIKIYFTNPPTGAAPAKSKSGPTCLLAAIPWLN